MTGPALPRRTCQVVCLATILGCIGAEAAPRQVILPAVASIHGLNGTFFRSDVHLFNHGNSRVSVQMTYRCWAGQSCGSPATIVLDPRSNRRIEDIVNTLFAAPETAGAVEIAFDDSAGPITVRSRMYTGTSEGGTYGQAVPGLDVAAARRLSVLNFIPLSTDPRGSRSNLGGYNPSDTPAATMWELHRADGTVMGMATKMLAPREAFQAALPALVSAAAAANEPGAYLLVSSDVPIFAYASVIDNQTGDAMFELAADDVGSAGTTEVVIECSRYKFSPGSGTTPLLLTAGMTYRLRFHTLDTTHGLTPIQQLGIAGGEIAPGSDYIVAVIVPEALRGSRFNFSCARFCGAGHGSMFGSIEIR